MTPLDYAVRLFVLIVYLLTALTCVGRGFLSRELRARFGNWAFGAVTAAVTWSQIPLRDTPITSRTWVIAVAGLFCVAYLIVLKRKGWR